MYPGSEERKADHNEIPNYCVAFATVNTPVKQRPNHHLTFFSSNRVAIALQISIISAH